MILVFGLDSPNHDLFTRASWLEHLPVRGRVLDPGRRGDLRDHHRGIDLSVGAVLGFTGMVSGAVMQSMLSSHENSLFTTVVGFAVALGLGAFIGFVNGYIITRLKLPPFIVTLGSLTAVGAAPALINGGNEISTLPSQISTSARLPSPTGFITQSSSPPWFA